MDSSDEDVNEDEDIEDHWAEQCSICKIYLLDDDVWYDLEEDDVKCENCWYNECKNNK